MSTGGGDPPRPGQVREVSENWNRGRDVACLGSAYVALPGVERCGGAPSASGMNTRRRSAPVADEAETAQRVLDRRGSMRGMGFQIANDPAADQVLDEHPFAVVVGMMLDQQYGMEHAFRGGWKVLSRFGNLDPAAIAAADPEAFKDLCSQTPAIHRFPGSMAARLQQLAALIESEYDGDVTRLWTEPTTGKELLRRVQRLPGFGKQKAQIFVALLAKQLGVRPEGWQAVAGDYALDGHRSVADVVDAGSLLKVREFKQQKKAAARAAGK